MLRRQVCRATGVACAALAHGSARSLSYTPRVREFQFLNDEVLDMYNHYGKLGVADNANKELCESLLEEAAKLAANELFPSYMTGDDEGCTLHPNTDVTAPKSFKAGYDAIMQGGWMGISSPEKYGGQGLPSSVGYQSRELMATANWSLAMYPGLSGGAAQTLQLWGTEEQKETYLTKIIAGEWSGTMCLTEPHCGTDLAQVKTKAADAPDGKSYLLTGTKIFISAGDHDMAENIIHIVLARLPNAPPGIKGISLFVVPKYVLKEDGTLDKSKKNVVCTGIEKKMGIKGSATAQLQFDNSLGYLIGNPHEGMKAMFTFMNAARIGTAIQGVSHAELAFQNALIYARERGSMRALSGTKESEKPADAIIHHPNVRHNVFFCKAVSEAGRCFVVDIARLLDIIESPNSTEAQKKAADGELGWLTPIAKGCLTELGLEAASNGVQVFGGHGFIKGNGMEQILRDARISTLYEGTTGIQALDFIGRKTLMNKGSNAFKFMDKCNALAKECAFQGGELGRIGRKLWVINKQWKFMTVRLIASAMRDKDSVGCASQDYLMYSGYVVMLYYWLRMGRVALDKVKHGKDPDGYYQAKVDMMNFYVDRILPRTDTHIQVMFSSSSTLMKVNEKTLDL